MLKVNDRVKIIGVNWLKANNYIGKEGVVNTIGMNDSRGGSYVFVKGIKMKSGVKTSWFPESSLEKIEHEKLPPPEKPPEFKVGDEVEIIGESYTNNRFHIGDKATIFLDYNDVDYGVLFPSGVPGVYSASSLKLITKEPKFKVGDRVYSCMWGLGRIIKVILPMSDKYNHNHYHYICDNQDSLHQDESCLTLVTEENRVDYPKPVTFYCCYVEGKSAPVIQHPTQEEAEKEAERLARKENRKVYVLKAIKSCEIPDSPVKWNNL